MVKLQRHVHVCAVCACKHTYHWASSWGSASTVFTMRAPWMGGLEYVGRTTFFSWDVTASPASASWVTCRSTQHRPQVPGEHATAGRG